MVYYSYINQPENTMQIIEQASKQNGAYIETKFSTGAYCRQMKNGGAQYYNAGGYSLNLVKNAKLIEKMIALAAKGIQ